MSSSPDFRAVSSPSCTDWPQSSVIEESKEEDGRASSTSDLLTDLNASPRPPSTIRVDSSLPRASPDYTGSSPLRSKSPAFLFETQGMSISHQGEGPFLQIVKMYKYTSSYEKNLSAAAQLQNIRNQFYVNPPLTNLKALQKFIEKQGEKLSELLSSPTDSVDFSIEHPISQYLAGIDTLCSYLNANPHIRDDVVLVADAQVSNYITSKTHTHHRFERSILLFDEHITKSSRLLRQLEKLNSYLDSFTSSPNPIQKSSALNLKNSCENIRQKVILELLPGLNATNFSPNQEQLISRLKTSAALTATDLLLLQSKADLPNAAEATLNERLKDIENSLYYLYILWGCCYVDDQVDYPYGEDSFIACRASKESQIQNSIQYALGFIDHLLTGLKPEVAELNAECQQAQTRYEEAKKKLHNAKGLQQNLLDANATLNRDKTTYRNPELSIQEKVNLSAKINALKARIKDINNTFQGQSSDSTKEEETFNLEFNNFQVLRSTLELSKSVINNLIYLKLLYASIALDRVSSRRDHAILELEKYLGAGVKIQDMPKEAQGKALLKMLQPHSQSTEMRAKKYALVCDYICSDSYKEYYKSFQSQLESDLYDLLLNCCSDLDSFTDPRFMKKATLVDSLLSTEESLQNYIKTQCTFHLLKHIDTEKHPRLKIVINRIEQVLANDISRTAVLLTQIQKDLLSEHAIVNSQSQIIDLFLCYLTLCEVVYNAICNTPLTSETTTKLEDLRNIYSNLICDARFLALSPINAKIFTKQITKAYAVLDPLEDPINHTSKQILAYKFELLTDIIENIDQLNSSMLTNLIQFTQSMNYILELERAYVQNITRLVDIQKPCFSKMEFWASTFKTIDLIAPIVTSGTKQEFLECYTKTYYILEEPNLDARHPHLSAVHILETALTLLYAARTYNDLEKEILLTGFLKYKSEEFAETLKALEQ